MDVAFVNLAGLLLIAVIVWYFFLSRRPDQAAAQQTSAGQEIEVRVKGGYEPELVVARAGTPLRILFRRQETSPCSEEVVFPSFGIRRHLPAFETTVITIPASAVGRYPFSCGMNMMHGTLVLSETAIDDGDGDGDGAPAESPQEKPAAVDPVCGMSVNPETAAATSVRDGVTFYFCGAGCKRRFEDASHNPS